MLGRRKTIFVGSFIMCIGALLQCTSYQLGQFIVGRLVTGFGRCNRVHEYPTCELCNVAILIPLVDRKRNEHLYRAYLAVRVL